MLRASVCHCFGCP